MHERIRGYSPRQSVLAYFEKVLAPFASENGVPLSHYKKQEKRRRGADEGWGSGGLEKIFRPTPSRTSDNAFLEQEIKVAIIIDLCAPTHTGDNFRIIGQARSSFHVSVLESFYIKTQNPVLCK